MAVKSRLDGDAHGMARNIVLVWPATSTDLVLSIAVIVSFIFIAQWAVQSYKLWQWHVINNSNWWNRSKAKEAFRWNARKLLYEGFAKFPKGYLVDTDMQRLMLLSPKYADEIRGDSRLDFMKSNEKDFLGHLPGFEVFKHHGKTTDVLNAVVRMRLTQSLGLVTEDISEEMADVLPEQWTEKTEWHEVQLKVTMLQIVARLSSRVFLGPELCRDPDWLRITIDFTVNVFVAVAAIKRWPKFMHPIVHWFLPESRKVRAQRAEARRIIQPVIDKRTREFDARLRNKINDKQSRSSDKYTDAVQWMHELSDGAPYDAAIAQLGLSMAAIHTTTDLTTQVLYDLCQHPELIEPLREEAINVLSDGGWKRTSLYKMKLMDSVLKESQRLKPSSMVSMRRLATEDISLQDGLQIPKGSMLGVSGHWSWDSSFYESPDKFDGYRFLKLAQNPDTEKMSHFVATSPQHLGFGHGKHACPGRFFASNEVKIALTHILLKYDFKLEENGAGPQVFKLGWMMQSDSQTKILVRRRREEVSLA